MKQNFAICKNFCSTCFIVSILAIIFLFIFPVRNSAQENEIHFSNITSEDGLSINGVMQLLQDSNGFIWLGTYSGLNRYDGYNFKIYLPESGNINSISNHSLYALKQDRNGNIWCGTQDGLNKFDWKTERFTRFKNNPKESGSISNNHIYSVYEDHSGIIWVGTLNGLNKYNPQKKNFSVIKKVNTVLNPDSLNSVTCIEEDKTGNLWLGTWDGLVEMNREGKVLKSFFAEGLKTKSINYRKINCVLADKSNTIWVGTGGKGLQKYNSKLGNFISYRTSNGNQNSISNDNITVIYEDRLGNIWVGTKNGLNKFNPKTNSFIRYFYDSQKPLSLVNNEILSIMEDKNGMIWIGTSGGVSRFYQTGNKFSYIEQDQKNPDRGLTNNQVSSVIIDSKNNFWIGTLNGLNKIAAGSKNISHIVSQPGNSNSIGSNIIMSVYEDQLGYIWIGTNDVSLNRMNPTTGEIKKYKYDSKDPTSLSNEGVTTICEDRKGNIWFGTWWGLNRYDRKTDKFYRYMANPQNSSALKVDLIWKVFEDSKGIIWVGTDGGGVSKFNLATNNFTNFFPDSTGSNSIKGNIGITIFESRDGMLWFGTNEGLNRYDRKSGKFKSYGKEDGLPGIFVNSIEEDDAGFLWISGDKGLTKFDRSRETFVSYSKKDGLKDPEFSARVSCKTKDGTLYFGTKKGLLYFDPQNLADSRSTAPVVFTDLKIFNQSVSIATDGSTILDSSITGRKKIEIPFREDVISLEFSLLDYFNPRLNNYAYKMEGFDQKWNVVGNRNSATYTNLPPGEYNFIVRAYNGSWVKNPKQASIRIIVVPTFFQTWLFKIILISILGILGFLYIQRRTKRMVRINQALELRVAERTKDLDTTISELSQEIVERKKAEEKVQASLEEKEVLLKEVHHRVKNNLQVISSLLYLQSKHIKDEDTQNLFLDSQNRIKSMALIHEKLYQSKNFSKISFIDYVTSLLEHLNASHQKNSQYIKTKILIENLYLTLDTVISCGLIVNELMTNAFKYAFPLEWLAKKEIGYEPTIEIAAFKQNENEFQLKVQDNGIGFSDNIDLERSDSLGLKIVNSMVNQINGSVKIENNSGTSFIITFTDEE